MSLKIVRLTRHKMGQEQEDELRRVFGKDATIEMVSETLPSNPREAVARFDEIATGVDVVEAVLPINLLEAVLKFSQFSMKGGVVIRAITNRQLKDGGSVEFVFDRYEKVVKVEIITETL